MGKPLNYSEREKSPAYQLWQASNAWRRMVNRALEPIGLTHVQFVLLASIQFLREEAPPVSQVCVARFAAIDQNMNSQVIRMLEKKGLLCRVPSIEDKRAFSLELTAQGEQLANEARAAVKKESEQFFAPLGIDSELLASLLRKLGCNEIG